MAREGLVDNGEGGMLECPAIVGMLYSTNLQLTTSVINTIGLSFSVWLIWHLKLMMGIEKRDYALQTNTNRWSTDNRQMCHYCGCVVEIGMTNTSSKHYGYVSGDE